MRLFRLNARVPIAVAAGAAVAATVLVGAAQAAETGRSIDEAILRQLLLGLGLQDPNAPQPSYEERPPLVIPKSDTLPSPQTSGTAIANNPAWPKDPDIVHAKALAEREKNRDVAAEMLREENPLPPDQLGPTGPGPRQASAGGAPRENYSGLPRILSPSELGYKGGLFGNIFGSDKDEETARFTGEPARTSLTEPPPGYRTPSPDQPYGLGKANTAPKAENSYLTRGEINPNQ